MAVNRADCADEAFARCGWRLNHNAEPLGDMRRACGREIASLVLGDSLDTLDPHTSRLVQVYGERDSPEEAQNASEVVNVSPSWHVAEVAASRPGSCSFPRRSSHALPP
jgi:hypothetical protein